MQFAGELLAPGAGVFSSSWKGSCSQRVTMQEKRLAITLNHAAEKGSTFSILLCYFIFISNNLL